MNYYIASTITELGLNGKISLRFPSDEHLQFIEFLMKQNDAMMALQNCSVDTVRDFEENGLQSLVSAEEFFQKMLNISTKGSYRCCDLRMDIQVANRTNLCAPDCRFNMAMTTLDWKKTMNISPSTAEKLLLELIKARSIIHEDQEQQLEQLKQQEQ